MTICTARGPLSGAVLTVLGNAPRECPELLAVAEKAATRSRDMVDDEDVQLALFLLYELHYGGLDGVDDAWEWSPGLLAARGVLETGFEQQLRAEYRPQPLRPEEVPAALFELAAPTGPPGGAVGTYLAREATLEQVQEMLVLRSPYQLKEADPQTWAIPRLRGAAKAALVEIQADEYGGGRPSRLHQDLFAQSMAAVGLSSTPGAYLDHLPALTLAVGNAMSMFGLHRRLRGALVGQLAGIEMTSSLPCRRWVTALERLGFGPAATEYWDEHVEADAVHEQIAGHDLCGSLVTDEPQLAEDVVFGAMVCHGLDGRLGDHVLDAWRAGRTALRHPLPQTTRSGRPRHPHVAA